MLQKNRHIRTVSHKTPEVFAERLILSQVKDFGTQMHNISFFQCGSMPCLNTLVRTVGYLIALLRYTLL